MENKFIIFHVKRSINPESNYTMNSRWSTKNEIPETTITIHPKQNDENNRAASGEKDRADSHECSTLLN